MKSLKWHQVNAWRLAQHYLSTRLERDDFVKAVTLTGGIQAQVMSAAELALWARVDGLAPQDVQNALWQDHTLIKTWAMRGTLHLITASELPLYVAARSHYDNRNWIGYFAYYGISPAQYEAFMAAVPEVLGSEPMTREALAAAIASHTGIPAWRDLILASSWGSPLKPSAFRGDLCFGPSQGQNVTFVHPGKWTGSQASIEPQTALQEMVRRYLRVYGPAIPEDFARWWWGGGGLALTRKLFKSLDDELEMVEVEGWQAFALKTTLESLQSLAQDDVASNLIHLLPLFDAYTLGLSYQIEHLLPAGYKSLVFRPQGWISSIVVINGSIKGVWEYKTRRTGTTVTIHLFSAAKTELTSVMKQAVEVEAERLGIFLNTRVVLEYGEEL